MMNTFAIYGFLRRLMSDQGREFCNDILKEMCYYLNIKKIRTTPYHPQSNGAVERVHQTLHQMIGKLDNKRCKKWPDHLGTITHAYNSTRSQVTGYSPYFLMMGHRPRLPVDLVISHIMTITQNKRSTHVTDSIFPRKLRSKIVGLRAIEEVQKQIWSNFTLLFNFVQPKKYPR